MPSSWTKFFLLLICILLPLTAKAQQVSGEFNAYLLSIEGLVVGTTLNVDAAYGEKYGHIIDAPFRVLIPTSDEIRELLDPSPQNGDALVKIHFATQDKQPIENIQFITMRVDMGDVKQRLDSMARLLVNNAFKQVIANHKNPTRDVVRAIKLDDYDAVEVIGTYEDAKFGLIYTRIVGILNPDKPEGVVALANVISSRLKLEKPDDFPRTRGGALLRNFRYLPD